MGGTKSLQQMIANAIDRPNTVITNINKYGSHNIMKKEWANKGGTTSL